MTNQNKGSRLKSCHQPNEVDRSTNIVSQCCSKPVAGVRLNPDAAFSTIGPTKKTVN